MASPATNASDILSGFGPILATTAESTRVELPLTLDARKDRK